MEANFTNIIQEMTERISSTEDTKEEVTTLLHWTEKNVKYKAKQQQNPS